MEELLCEFAAEEEEESLWGELGVDYPILPEDEEIYVQWGRIHKLQNIHIAGAKLKQIRLIANWIKRIENLETAVNLEHLELYQNKITKIQGSFSSEHR